MSRLRWLGLLMIVTILGITGFQLYWLRQNYSREKRSLEIRTEMAFRQTIMKLQVSKLKLDTGAWTHRVRKGGGKGGVKIMMGDPESEEMDMQFIPREGVVSTINVIRDKLRDSVKVNTRVGPQIMVMDKNVNVSSDTIGFEKTVSGREGLPPDNIYNFLYGVDSIQDSLRLSEVDSAFRIALERVNAASVPFTIKKTLGGEAISLQRLNEVTIGLAKPVTFKLELGNTFPYLIRQIMQPILFSILLSGITILSFLLLYKSLLRQKRLAALKNEFISNITHELKTPIATVGVAIEALKNFNAIDDPKRTREYLDISQNELQRLSLLVDKVLKLSMFEKKEIELKNEALNLKDVVEEVVNSLRLQLEKNKAKVWVKEQGDLSMKGDRLHLLSVVFNLLDNAVKYSRGEALVEVDLKGDEKTITLTVTDNGIGIAHDYKEKVFEKFFRVPHGDTHNAKGYGLGLSYVAQVVEKHGGTISLESQPGIGSRFIITLPKEPA